MSDTTINTVDVVKNIKDKIKDTFASLIPDDQWEAMIQKEIDDFMKPKEDNYRRYDDKISDFSRIVNEILVEETTIHVKEYIKEHFGEFGWEGNKLKVNKNLRKMIIQDADKILESIISNTIQQALNNIRNPY